MCSIVDCFVLIYLHTKVQISQEKLSERQERYLKARRLLLKELEEEAPLWITTAEEIEEKLSDDQFWHHPSLVGARPDDAIFWQYEGLHAPEGKRKIYQTPRELFLEYLLNEYIYTEGNKDENVWTDEAEAEYESKLERARLRALVKSKGRRAMYSALNDDFSEIRSKRQLYKLIAEGKDEEVGVEMLLKNPSDFIDEKEVHKLHKSSGEIITEKERRVKVESALPILVGRHKDPYSAEELTLRDKLKNRKLRSKQQATKADKKPQETDFDEDTELAPIVLDEEEYDTEDDDFVKSHHFSERFSDADIDWIKDKLEEHINRLGEVESKLSRTKLTNIADEIETNDSDFDVNKVDSSVSSFEDFSTEQVDFDIVNSLTEEQQQKLSTLDFELTSIDEVDQLTAAIREQVPGLTEEQITSLVQLEVVLFENDGNDDDLEDVDHTSDTKPDDDTPNK